MVITRKGLPGNDFFGVEIHYNAEVMPFPVRFGIGNIISLYKFQVFKGKVLLKMITAVGLLRRYARNARLVRFYVCFLWYGVSINDEAVGKLRTVICLHTFDFYSSTFNPGSGFSQEISRIVLLYKYWGSLKIRLDNLLKIC